MSLNCFSINPTKIYVYLRVSCKAQMVDSNGLEEQNTICNEYINKYFSGTKYEVEYSTDIGSSYNNKNKLTNLNKIKRKIAYTTNSLLLIRDVSRLGRCMFDVFTLLKVIKKTNSHIIAINENLCYNKTILMDKKFAHNVINSEENSDLKSIKITDRIQYVKKMGGYIGRVPYGTKLIKKNNIPHIYKNQKEIKMLKLIKKIFLQFNDVNKTTVYLNKNNFRYRNNTIWTDKKISSVLKKFFPNITLNKNSDLTNIIFSKYPNYKRSIKVKSQIDKSCTCD